MIIRAPLYQEHDYSTYNDNNIIKNHLQNPTKLKYHSNALTPPTGSANDEGNELADGAKKRWAPESWPAHRFFQLKVPLKS